MSSSAVTSRSPKPVVLVPACNRMGEHLHLSHVVGKKYTDFVRLAGCLPLIVPSAEPEELDTLLATAHGLLLTGSPSNVHPRHFNEDVLDPSLPLDMARDAWILPLIPKALELGMPLFGICRGFQEVNVALGGSLHQAVHGVPGYADHRSDDDDPLDEQYAPVHEVIVEPGGRLARTLERERFDVNSLHGQGVNRLAPGVRVEARAPDGLVEAFSIEGATGFALCVQWHPEWHAAENPISSRLLQTFGDACRRYRDRDRPDT